MWSLFDVPGSKSAAASPPDGLQHRLRRGGGGDNGDAALKNLLIHYQVVLPITNGRLDFGPWLGCSRQDVGVHQLDPAHDRSTSSKGLDFTSRPL
jgi:thiamine phosphate synthase YjbQ (UPF0047 family)